MTKFEMVMQMLDIAIKGQTDRITDGEEAVYKFEGMADPNSPHYKTWLSMIASTTQRVQAQYERLSNYQELKKELEENGLEADLEEWLDKLSSPFIKTS